MLLTPYSQLTRKWLRYTNHKYDRQIFIRVYSVHAVGRIRLGAQKLQ